MGFFKSVLERIIANAVYGLVSGVAVTIWGLISHLPTVVVFVFALGALGITLIVVNAVRDLLANRAPQADANGQRADGGLGHLRNTLLQGLGIVLIGAVAWWIYNNAGPCPPSGIAFYGNEYILMEAHPGKEEIRRLRESFYYPAGSTPAVAVRVTVGEGVGSIVWSDDGSEPTRIAEAKDVIWLCRDRISKFRVKLRGDKTSALFAGYAW